MNEQLNHLNLIMSLIDDGQLQEVLDGLPAEQTKDLRQLLTDAVLDQDTKDFNECVHSWADQDLQLHTDEELIIWGHDAAVKAATLIDAVDEQIQNVFRVGPDFERIDNPPSHLYLNQE